MLFFSVCNGIIFWYSINYVYSAIPTGFETFPVLNKLIGKVNRKSESESYSTFQLIPIEFELVLILNTIFHLLQLNPINFYLINWNILFPIKAKSSSIASIFGVMYYSVSKCMIDDLILIKKVFYTTVISPIKISLFI